MSFLVEVKEKDRNTLNELGVPVVTEGILFGGERWMCATKMLVAHNDGDLAGLATLNEKGIEGCWVKPKYRRQGVALKILEKACDIKSVVEVECVTPAMVAVCRCAVQQGRKVKVMDFSFSGFVLK